MPIIDFHLSSTFRFRSILHPFPTKLPRLQHKNKQISTAGWISGFSYFLKEINKTKNIPMVLVRANFKCKLVCSLISRCIIQCHVGCSLLQCVFKLKPGKGEHY